MSQWGFLDPFPAAGDNGFLNFNLDDRTFFNQDRPTPNPRKSSAPTQADHSSTSKQRVNVFHRNNTPSANSVPTSFDGTHFYRRQYRTDIKDIFLDSRVRAAQQQRMRMWVEIDASQPLSLLLNHPEDLWCCLGNSYCGDCYHDYMHHLTGWSVSVVGASKAALSRPFAVEVSSCLSCPSCPLYAWHHWDDILLRIH